MGDALGELIGALCCMCCSDLQCDCDCFQCPNCDCPAADDTCCDFSCPTCRDCTYACPCLTACDNAAACLCCEPAPAAPSGRVYDQCVDSGCCDCAARCIACHWLGDGGCCGTPDATCQVCYCDCDVCYYSNSTSGDAACLRNQDWGPGIGTSGDCDKPGDFCERPLETCAAWTVCCPCTLAIMWGSVWDNYRACVPYVFVTCVAPVCSMIAVRRLARRRHLVREQDCAMLTDCIGVTCCCPCVTCQLMRASHYDEWCPCADTHPAVLRSGRPFGSGTQQWAVRHSHVVQPGPAFLTAQPIAPPIQGPVMGVPIDAMSEPRYSYRNLTRDTEGGRTTTGSRTADATDYLSEAGGVAGGEDVPMLARRSQRGPRYGADDPDL